jgi:HEAT repeat protein
VIVAEILCKAGGKDVLPTVRKLLLDPRPVVRLRAALALAAVKDVDAISTLIALLAELPPVLGRQAEEFLVNLAADQAPKVPLADNEASRKACHDAWASWWQGTEGLASLQEFRKRTLTEADREKVQVLIKQLGDEDFGVRQRASLALDGYSNSIAPLLRQALTSDDEEIKKRVRNCLDKIDKEKSAPLLSVQARLVAFRKPERAVEVLLAFLPFADDEATLDEVRAALAAVAVRDGMPDPAIVKGMEDKLPLRRGIAAEALALGGATDQRPALRKMLQDSDPNVRLRVALALATVHDREAVPVLIDLLGDLPSSSGTQAELFLRGLVGEQAPTVYLSTDDASRQKVKEAWAAWWKDNGAAVDMNRPISGPRLLGYTLLIATDFNRIVEVGLDGKERWNLDNLQYPRDAQVLPGDRILIAEQGIHRVAEWNSRREILWHKQVNGPPVSCQRLANGNTGITMANGLLEVDRNGKDVFTYQRPQHDIMCGSRGSDGQWVFITHACQVIRVDSTGKEIKSFSTGGGQVPWSIELLPNSRILMPLPGHNRVVEYDSDGKIVWEVAVQNPFSAQRLSNGNTLVASPQLMKVFELNRGGRVVWEHTAAQMDRPQRARRR